VVGSKENTSRGTSTNSAFFSQVDYFRIARHPPLDVPLRIAVKYPLPRPAYQLTCSSHTSEENMPNVRKETGILRIVIVGGGFAGVTLAEDLNRRCARDVEVVVISSENHMVFTPMLAEVAGRSLSGLDVVVSGRQVAPRASWLTATVTGVDLKKHEVEYTRPDGKIATLSYAHLVLACGSEINLDVVPGMAAHAYTLRTVGDGLTLGNEVIARF
jgi:hypothetical protein